MGSPLLGPFRTLFDTFQDVGWDMPCYGVVTEAGALLATFWDTFWSLPGSRFGGDLLDRA